MYCSLLVEYNDSMIYAHHIVKAVVTANNFGHRGIYKLTSLYTVQHGAKNTHTLLSKSAIKFAIYSPVARLHQLEQANQSEHSLISRGQSQCWKGLFVKTQLSEKHFIAHVYSSWLGKY